MIRQTKIPNNNAWMTQLDELADSETRFKSKTRWFWDNSKTIVRFGAGILGAAAIAGTICYTAGQDNEREKSEEARKLEEFQHQEHLKNIIKMKDESITEEKAKAEAEKKARVFFEEEMKKYKQQWEAADALSTTYKKRIDEQNERVITLEGTISTLEQSVKEANDTIENTQIELRKVKAQFDAFVVKYDDLDKKYKDKCIEYDNLKKELERIISDYEKLQEDVNKKVENSETINNAMARDKERLEQEKKAVQEDLQRSRTAYAELEGIKKELQERYARAQRDLETLTAGKEGVEREFTETSKKSQEQAEEIAKLKRYSSELEDVIRKRSEEARMYEERIAVIIEKHKEELKKKDAAHEAVVSRITTNYEKEKAGLIAQNEEARKELEEKKDAIERLDDILKGFKEKIEVYEAQQKKDQETITSQKTNIEDLEKKVAQLEEQARLYVAQIESDQSMNNNQKERITELLTEITNLGKTLATTRTENEDLIKRLEDIVRRKTELDQLLEAIPEEYKMLYRTRIAYVSNMRLYISDGDPQCSNRKSSFSLGSDASRPRISPDRRYITFEQKSLLSLDPLKENAIIMVYKINPSLEQNVELICTIDFKEAVSEPTWIDSSMMAFIAGEKRDELWIYDVDSKKMTCLVKNEIGRISEISASPDGKRITYVVFSDYDDKNACQIWMTSELGSNRRRISLEDDKYNIQPFWIDNETLVYTREGRSYDSEVCLVRIRSDGAERIYRSVTSNSGFPKNIFARNSADYNPTANSEGLVLFTNESDGIVLRHPKKSLQSGLLDDPDETPYEQEDVIVSEAVDRHSRAQFYEDGRSILVKVKNRLYRFKKVNGEYQRQFVADVDPESDFDIR